MPKIILDTNIYISALLFSNVFQNKVLKIIKNHETIISEEILRELRNKLKNKFKISREVLNIFDSEFLTKIKIKKIDPNIKILKCRDPKDNHLLELSQTTQADYLITGDKDLLVLKKINKTKIVTIANFSLKKY